MLSPLFMLWTIFLYGFSAAEGETENECFGSTVTLPSNFAPAFYKGPIRFTPSNGGPSKLMMDNGEPKDPRLEHHYITMKLKDLRVEDDGYFSVSFDGSEKFKILTLKILDCADDARSQYGERYTYRVSSQADFLEYTPLKNSDGLKILWNRSDPSIGAKKRKNQMKDVGGDHFWEMLFVTQKQNGYYNFRQKNNNLVSRFHLKVGEHQSDLIGVVGNQLRIIYPWAIDNWTATFIPDSNQDYSANFRRKQDPQEPWFVERIVVNSGSIDIDPVQSKDAGIFNFRDEEGNLVWVVHLKIENDFTWVKYVAIVAVILLMVLFCCCCFCCKKRRSKRETVTLQKAVYFHDESTPSVPAPSASTPPVNPYTSNKPAATPQQPTAYSPVNVHLNPSEPQGSVPLVQPSVPAPPIGSGFLSSDTEPRFELKGMTFLSAPPLNSNSAECGVYHSDKLNFL